MTTAYPELLLLDQQWDLEKGIIHFLWNEEVLVRARMTLIGSWGRSERWRWAWPNESLPSAARDASLPLRELADITGRPEFLSEDAFPASAAEADNLVADACRFLGAASVCKRDTEHAVFWFALHDVEFLQSLEALTKLPGEIARQIVAEGDNVALLNALRSRFPSLRLELIGQDLRGEPEVWAHDLHARILFDFNLIATRKARDLSGANLSSARFDESIFRGVVLRDATFERTSLVNTDLSRADLRGVSFRNAFLNGTSFNRALLAGADFTGAELSGTLLTDVDLSEVRGLDAVHHLTPSEISLSTLTASQFKVSPVFLRRAGVSRGLIEDLARGRRFARQYETCFLSYSSKDAPFAEKVYRSLQDAGVRVFWDRFDVLPGESLRDQLIEAIRQHDRLIVVLSDSAMASDWVRQEIELAWYHKRDSLVPIRLCDIEPVRAWTARHKTLPDLAGYFPVLDFSGWRNEEDYTRTVSLLLRSLAGGAEFDAST